MAGIRSRLELKDALFPPVYTGNDPIINLPCPNCGSTARRTAPGSGPHHQRLECAECSRWLKWLPLARNGLNLRQYQKEAVATVLDHLKNEQCSPCLDIPTCNGPQ